MAADYDMMIDSSDDEVHQRVAKRAKFTHISLSKKRLERDIPEIGYDRSKRAKKSLPNHDRPEFFHEDAVSKRLKLHADLGLHPRPSHRHIAHARPVRKLERLARPPDSAAFVDHRSPSQADDDAKVYSDINQSDDREAEVVTLVAADNDEVHRQKQLRWKGIEHELLEKLVEDRLRAHRIEEDTRERHAKLKSRIQSRVHREINQRADRKSPAQLLVEFCGIRCNDHSRDALKRAFRRALAQVHPDRMQQKPLEQIVEAEEIYKLLQPIYCEL